MAPHARGPRRYARRRPLGRAVLRDPRANRIAVGGAICFAGATARAIGFRVQTTRSSAARAQAAAA